MIRYERVRFQDGDNGPVRSVRLQIIKDDGQFVVGYEINGEGERIEPPGADERIRVIQKALIRRRTTLRMNPHYGTLENAAQLA